MALRMSSLARPASTISPLRTPRERDWPTPMMLSAPASLTSPTMAQIFDVPASSPTMTVDWSSMFLFVERDFVAFGDRGRRRAGVEPEHRGVVGDRQIERANGLADFFPVIEHQPPVAQLLLEAVEGESDLVPLPGRDLQHIGPGDVHALEVHQAGHGRVFEPSDQTQRGADPGRGDRPA